MIKSFGGVNISTKDVKRHFKLIVLLMLVSILLLSSYTQNVQSKTVYKNGNSSTNSVSSEGSNEIASNIVTKANNAASKVPKLFYKYLNEKKYDKAVKLLGPTLKFEGSSSMIKYLKNIEHTDFIEFRDVSGKDAWQDGDNIDSVKQKYYAIKVYYAVLKMKVKDKKLVPRLTKIQYRKMFVVKVKKNSPWQLDGDEDAPQLPE